MYSTLTIYEEETNLLWGLVVVVAAAGATYLLGDAFVNESLFIIGFRQLLSFSLFILAFVGIVKITEPLYRFELEVEGKVLTINAFKGDDEVQTFRYNLNKIDELRFAPKTPSLQGDALFDFSPNYHLVYRSVDDGQYHKLIDLDGVSFTLKVPDIAKIIRLMRRYNPSIDLPEEQKPVLS